MQILDKHNRYWNGSIKKLQLSQRGLRHHSPTPQGAAVVVVPSSDRHHDGGLAGTAPIRQQIKSINHPNYLFHFIIDPTTAAAAAGKVAAVAVVPTVVVNSYEAAAVGACGVGSGDDGVVVVRMWWTSPAEVAAAKMIMATVGGV
nr:hypothetical protein [Tanacetum cinerariifolium]